MKKILVIGSINIDLVVSAVNLPKPGETVAGTGFNTFPGGKGANQAVAAGKLGADVAMAGKVGLDSYGRLALNSFKSAGVKTDFVEEDNSAGTGIAVISVAQSGENSIVYVQGANALADNAFADKYRDAVDACDILLLQLEIPLATVDLIAAYAASKGKTVILDPAPAQPLPDSLLKNATYITPNETEIETLTGIPADSEEGIIKAAGMLLKKGVDKVINKAGAKGAYLISAEGIAHIPGFCVKAADTTAAGDTFNAAFAMSLANGMDESESIRYANAAAAISVTKLGAQSAMPSKDEVRALLNSDQN